MSVHHSFKMISKLGECVVTVRFKCSRLQRVFSFFQECEYPMISMMVSKTVFEKNKFNLVLQHVAVVELTR